MNMTQNTIRAATFFLAGAITLCALQATARAADDGLPKQTVSYADLDISKPAGAKVLYHRIKAAANEVCGYSVSGDMGSSRRQYDCVQATIDKAVKDVDSPALSALRPSTLVHLANN
jgi:UrcA family protein